MEVDLASIRCRDEAVVFFYRNLRNSPMSFDLVELDLAARTLCQSLDLASGGRERVLDRDLRVHVAPVIGRLVADHDVLVGRDRHPNVDTTATRHPVMWCWYFSNRSTSCPIAVRTVSDGSAFSKLICNGICMNSLSGTGIDQPVGVALPAGLYSFCPAPRSPGQLHEFQLLFGWRPLCRSGAETREVIEHVCDQRLPARVLGGRRSGKELE